MNAAALLALHVALSAVCIVIIGAVTWLLWIGRRSSDVDLVRGRAIPTRLTLDEGDGADDCGGLVAFP